MGYDGGYSPTDSLADHISQLSKLLAENGIDSHFFFTLHVDLWPSYRLNSFDQQDTIHLVQSESDNNL